jgi:hypothetical protein
MEKTMKLNLRNNLFRYGKKQYLTFGVIIALIMFDTTVWNLMSMGMFSVDYRFSKENDCQSQVSYVLRDNVTRLEHYSAKSGKFCAAFQELYNEVRANKDVVNSSDAIKQTENKIDDILYLSPWTKSGWTYIKPLIYKLSNEYKIQLNDKGYIFTWDI